MNDFGGKIALITGGTRGLGRALALRLAEMGAVLALNYRRDEESALRTLAEVRQRSSASVLLKADLENDPEVRSMVARAANEFGRIDLLVINAAATAFKPLMEVKPLHLGRTFNLSVGGFVAAVQAAAGFMPSGGRVVMVSGIDSIRYMPGHGVLGAAKAAMESLVRYFAFELGERGITVNGVNFGLVDSDSSRLYLGKNFETARDAAAARSAIKRLPRVDEIADAITLLLRPEARFVTGQIIMADGGLSLASPFEP
jgi:enoyl-[acyl-carrier protein] reductase III